MTETSKRYVEERTRFAEEAHVSVMDSEKLEPSRYFRHHIGAYPLNKCLAFFSARHARVPRVKYQRLLT